VGVGSTLFWNYQACDQIVAGLRQRLTEEGIASLSELVGALRL